MKVKLATVLALTVALAACASDKAYGPAESKSAQGYTDRAIEEGRYQVTYRDRTLGDARDGALRRAAEITLAHGSEWFLIVREFSDGTTSKPSTSVGIGGHTGSGGSGVGVGVGLSFPLGGSSSVEYSFEFIVGSGERPAGDVYDAQSVLNTIP